MSAIGGYFNLEFWVGPVDDTNGMHRYLYECIVCHSLVLNNCLYEHIMWHANIKKPDKDKSPEEIQREAIRILAEMRAWEPKNELPLAGTVRETPSSHEAG